MGFAKTVVIDEDQGRSGSGLEHRPGFGQLLNAVCAGDAGAVFALEASRLARNSRDWSHLVDLCALTQTLLIDDEGVYDPRLLNDRLLLGLKGTMSEFELGLFRQRARQAFEQKVGRGYAMWEVPVGFVRREDNRMEKTPDLQVQQAIEGVFRKFRELASARQTTLWYHDEQIRLPVVKPGSSGKEVFWRLPCGHRITQILKNPSYAGALAYGRTQGITVIEQGRARQAGRKRKPLAEWKTLIQNNHAGYITWDDYLKNLQVLEANALIEKGQTGGAARSGAALLSGLLRCGRCGRRLFAHYAGKGGRVPRYGCRGDRGQRGSAACLSLGALLLDQAVCEQVLEAIHPVGVRAALDAAEQFSRQGMEKVEALHLALEKARYEANRAQRQYDAVDPENRLVACELEKRWNETMVAVGELENQIEQASADRPSLNADEKRRLLDLGRDVKSLWEHPQASVELKKRILRTVLLEIVVSETDEPSQLLLHTHWQGGVHTELRVARNTTGHHRRVARPEVADLVSELSKVCEDETIAATLNRLGYRTGTGNTWRKHSIWSFRHTHQLANHSGGQEWATIHQSAETLGVSDTVIQRLIRQGVLPAKQVVQSAPWIIARTDLQLPQVVAQIQAVHQGRQLPRHLPNQKEFPL
jgi:DNA invertase Pin-like site-specific DNA recombinase